MLRLKKKNEEKADVKEVSDSNGNNGTKEVTMTADDKESSDSSGGGINIIGIGGKMIRKEGAKAQGKRLTPGEIRIQKDIHELDGGQVANVSFPNPNDLCNFNVLVSPQTGYWVGAKYNFSFSVPADYPHKPPKVTCLTKIYHPNINLEGAVCLNILREDWKPVLDINAVIYGLIYIFYEPNPDDPLNHDAAALFRTDKAQFAKVVTRILSGNSHAGESFPKLI